MSVAGKANESAYCSYQSEREFDTSSESDDDTANTILKSPFPSNRCIWAVDSHGVMYVCDLKKLHQKQVADARNNCNPSDLQTGLFFSPFKTPLLSGFPVSSEITIEVHIDVNATRFYVNFVNAANDDIVFHFNPRFDQGIVIRNYTVNGHWYLEERSGPFLFSRNSNATITFKCLKEKIKVLFNGKTYMYFTHRIPPRKITDLSVGGDVRVLSFDYKPKKVILNPASLNWHKFKNPESDMTSIATCSADVTWGINKNSYRCVLLVKPCLNDYCAGDNGPNNVDIRSTYFKEYSDLKIQDLSLSVLDKTVHPKRVSVWAITTKGTVVYREGVNTNLSCGKAWAEVFASEPMSCISTSDGFNVWCCGRRSGKLYYRRQISIQYPFGATWDAVDPPQNQQFHKIAIGKESVWALNTNGEIFIRKGVTEEYPQGREWLRVYSDENRKFMHISARGENIWAVTLDGILCKRRGTHSVPEGVAWIYGTAGDWVHVNE